MKTQNTKAITNRIIIDLSTAREIYDYTPQDENGILLSADHRVALCAAYQVDAKGEWKDYIYYLETNGDPILVTDDNEWECAQMLGFDDISDMRNLY